MQTLRGQLGGASKWQTEEGGRARVVGPLGVQFPADNRSCPSPCSSIKPWGLSESQTHSRCLQALGRERLLWKRAGEASSQP